MVTKSQRKQLNKEPEEAICREKMNDDDAI
jgi:hypothetical protein